MAMARTGALAWRLTLAEREVAALKRGVAEAAPPPAPPPPEVEPGRPASEGAAAKVSPDVRPEPEPEPVIIPEPVVADLRAEPAVTPPAAPVSAPASATVVVARPRIDWERRIAANWMVWAGGLALALGGLFLVRIAIEAGFFGPTARTVLAGGLGVGLIAASFRVRHLEVVKTADTAVRRLPALMAGAGVVTLFGATLAAGVLYALLPPLAIFILFAAVSLIAAALAWIYGPALAALGLAGAYLGPFFTGAQGGSPLMLLPYAFAVTAGALAIIRLRGWPFVSWLALAGAMLWGVLGLTDPSPNTAWAAPVYALALAAIAALFGQHAARAPINWEGEHRFAQLREPGEALFVAHLFWIGAAALLVFSAVDRQIGALAGSALSLFAGMGLLASWRREGFGLLVTISAAAVLAALALWPSWIGAEPVYAAVMAGLFAGAGWILLPRLKVQTPVALVSALFAPAAFMIAAWRLERFDPGALWAVAALGLAAGSVLLIDRLAARDKGFKAHPGTGAVYGLATCIFLALAAVFALSGLWLGTGLALVALSLAALYRRFNLWLLRRAAVLAGAASVILLLRPDLLLASVISPLPVFNALSASFIPAIAALLAAAWLVRAEPATAQTLRGTAAFLGFALVGLLIRHWAGGGTLTGPTGGFGEASGYALAYLGGAAGLFWRNGQGVIVRLVRWGGLLAGLVGVAMAFGALEWDRALGAPVFNLLLTAFAVPAILLAVMGVGMRRAGLPVWGKTMAIASMALGFAWAMLETRRLFTGPALYAGGAPADAQMWSYSAAMVVYALVLLVLGAWRSAPLARFASLAVLAAALIKVFLFDMSALDGALRAASFIGLGLTLLGAALFYQRFVFTRSEGPPAPDDTTVAGREA